MRDPERQRLSQESAKYRTKLRNEETAHGETKTALADARKLNAFLIAAAGKVNDVDAAWKLCDQTALVLADDGTVSGARRCDGRSGR